MNMRSVHRLVACILLAGLASPTHAQDAKPPAPTPDKAPAAPTTTPPTEPASSPATAPATTPKTSPDEEPDEQPEEEPATKDGNPSDNQLHVSRIAYERTLESVREDTLKSLDAEENKLRAKAKPDAQAIAAVGKDRSAFQKSGAWPTVIDAKPLRARAARAASNLLKVYDNTRSSLIKTKKDDAAVLLDAERRIFETQTDLVPWSENTLAKTKDTDRTVNKDTRLELDADNKGPWRLSVSGVMTEPGDLYLDVPLKDRPGRTFKITINKKGEVQVFITLAEAGAIVDAGAEAETESSARDLTKPRLRAASGSFRIESARMKPLIAGSPEALPKKAQRPAPQQAVVFSHLQHWKKGDKVSGLRIHNKDKKDTHGHISAIDNTSITITTSGAGGTGTMAWRLTVNGDSLSLAEISKKGWGFDIKGGSGSIGEKAIQFTYQCTSKNGKRVNPDDGSFTLTRD